MKELPIQLVGIWMIDDDESEIFSAEGITF